jgi:hypothetical protein
MSDFNCFLENELRVFGLLGTGKRNALGDQCVSEQTLMTTLRENSDRIARNGFRIFEFLLSNENLSSRIVNLSDTDFSSLCANGVLVLGTHARLCSEKAHDKRFQYYS